MNVIDKLGNYYLIACPNEYIAKELFDDLCNIVKANNTLSNCLYLERYIRDKNGYEYKFIFTSDKYDSHPNYTVISYIEFEDMIKRF